MAPPQQSQQAPSFRVGVDLVSLNVTVTDGSARYLTDLQEAHFSVFEDGVKQEVTLFSRTNLPIALALLLDTSASMETKLPVAQEAAIGFGKGSGSRISPKSSALTAASSSCSLSQATRSRSSGRFAGRRPAARRR